MDFKLNMQGGSHCFILWPSLGWGWENDCSCLGKDGPTLQVFQKSSHMLLEDTLVATYFFISQKELHINQLCITKAKTLGYVALNLHVFLIRPAPYLTQLYFNLSTLLSGDHHGSLHSWNYDLCWYL